MSFSVLETLQQLKESAPENATVKTLPATSHVLDIIATEISHAADIHAVVPMIRTSRKAKTAIALYAGDGIVLKITHKDEVDHSLDSRFGEGRIIPGVLPPIRRFKVGDYQVEMYPWIDRKHVTQADVANMEKMLAHYNLKFKPGDNKRDNIGLLPGPGHKLAVLDADAVELLDRSFGILANDSRRWEQEIQTRFSPLYKKVEQPLVSEEPDFQERYSPLTGQKRERAPRRVHFAGTRDGGERGF